MGTIKDRNGTDLIEAEDIKKRWQEYTGKWHKKDLQNPENHDGVTTHLEPNILECEFKWGNWTISKPKRWCCESAQYGSKFAKLSSCHRTGKGQFSFQSQRKAMPKNAQTTAQFYSSPMLAKQFSKFSKPGFNCAWTENFQMLKLDLEKAGEPEIK